jgi:hypothetical protein
MWRSAFNPPKKPLDETLKAKIALCAIALKRSFYKNSDR